MAGQGDDSFWAELEPTTAVPEAVPAPFFDYSAIEQANAQDMAGADEEEGRGVKRNREEEGEADLMATQDLMPSMRRSLGGAGDAGRLVVPELRPLGHDSDLPPRPPLKRARLGERAKKKIHAALAWVKSRLSP